MEPKYFVFGFVILWVLIYLVFAPRDKRDKKVKQPKEKIKLNVFGNMYMI